jgi:hypothetical protein
MKRVSSFVVVATLAAAAGWFPARHFPNAAQTNGNGAEENTVSNECPMHPWVKLDMPGDCAI